MDGERCTMIILIKRRRNSCIKFKEGSFQTEESCQESRGALQNDKRVNCLQFLSEDITRGNTSQLILRGQHYLNMKNKIDIIRKPQTNISPDHRCKNNKILVYLMQQYIKIIIQPDQVGFMPGMHASFDIGKSVNVIFHNVIQQTKEEISHDHINRCKKGI